MPESYKIRLSYQFYDYRAETLQNQPVQVPAQVVQIAGYTAQLSQLPLRLIKESVNDLSLYQSTSPPLLESLKNRHPMVGGNHGYNKSRILLFGQVESATNPGDSYWIFKEESSSFSGSSTQIIIDFNLFEQMRVKDPLNGR